jgi:hemerythrin-like metal-binding protein
LRQPRRPGILATDNDAAGGLEASMQSLFATQHIAGAGQDSPLARVRSLDAGMENLFFILRQLGDPDVECRRRNFLCPRDQCGKIDAVIRYLERMFRREEAQMEADAYPERARHAQAHRDMLRRLRELQTARTCGRLEQSALAHRIRDWATEHMNAEDKPLGQWMRELQAG